LVVPAGDGALQRVDVRLHERVALVAHGTRAGVDAVTPVAAPAARPLRDALRPGVVVGERAVLSARVARVALLARRARLALEAVEARDDVAEETRLALPAVGVHVCAPAARRLHHAGYR